MKYIKLIIVTVTMASVAGFVIWHLMWMAEVEKKFRTGQSSGALNKTAGKEEKDKSRRGKTENTLPAAQEITVPVQERRTQTSQTGTGPQEMVKQAESKDARDTKQTVTETKQKSEQETGKWFEKDIGFGKKVQQTRPGPGNPAAGISDDKTISVTIKSNAGPVMQKNISQPQPIRIPDTNVINVPAYPTSTPP